MSRCSRELHVSLMLANNTLKILIICQASKNDGVHGSRWVLSYVNPWRLAITRPIQSHHVLMSV